MFIVKRTRKMSLPDVSGKKRHYATDYFVLIESRRDGTSKFSVPHNLVSLGRELPSVKELSKLLKARSIDADAKELLTKYKSRLRKRS